MIRDTYHIKVKEEYASTILEDLLEKDAIEIINDDVPEWQKEGTQRRLAELKSNPSPGMSMEDFFATLDADDDEV